LCSPLAKVCHSAVDLDVNKLQSQKLNENGTGRTTSVI